MPTTATGPNGPLVGLCPETARGDGEAKRDTDKAGQILNDKPLASADTTNPLNEKNSPGQ